MNTLIKDNNVLNILIILYLLAIIIISSLPREGSNIDIVISSSLRGNQVYNVTGHYLIGNDPNFPSRLILGFNGSKYGYADATWLLDTYFSKDLRKLSSAANVSIVIKNIPKLYYQKFIPENESEIIIYVNDIMVYQGKPAFLHPSYGYIPLNTSNVRILIDNNEINVYILPSVLDKNKTKIKLEVRGNVIWEIDLIQVKVEISKSFKMLNLHIIILGSLFAIILSFYYILLIGKIVNNFIYNNDKFVAILIVLSFIIRLTLAPYTQDEWDLPYFRNVSLMYFVADINPLYVWTYGIGWLGLLLSYSSLGLLTAAYLTKLNIYYILNLFIKLPIIFADLSIPLFIYINRNSLNIPDTKARYILILWLLNPYTILISSVWGQYDSIPTLLMILSLIYLAKGFIFRSAIFMALGFLFKFFTILILPIILIALLNSKKIKVALKFTIIVSLISLIQLLVYYVTVPQLIIDIIHYRAGISAWGEYYQGLTYLTLLWRCGLTKILQPSPFLLLYSAILITILIIIKFRRTDLLDITKPSNVLMLAYLSLIPFFLSYNMINQQYFMWILPLLLIISYGYKKLNLFIVNMMILLVTLYTLMYLIIPLRFILWKPPIFDLLSIYFTLLLILTAIILIKKSYVDVRLRAIDLLFTFTSFITLFVPVILNKDLLRLILIIQLITFYITTVIILLNIFKYFLFYKKIYFSLLFATNKVTRIIDLVFSIVYFILAINIIFINSTLQQFSFLRNTFISIFDNWKIQFNSTHELFYLWLLLIFVPQIFLSLLMFFISFLQLFENKPTGYSLVTSFLLIGYIIVYIFHTQFGYICPHDVTVPIIFLILNILFLLHNIFKH